jgi:spermidine synthase
LRKQKLSLFLLAATTLMLELLLTRVFDVILTPNMAYMVISCAMFSFGLAGIYVTVRPSALDQPVEARLSRVSLLFAVATLAILPLFNALPFDYEQIPSHPLAQTFFFAGMYLALVVPFFLSGLLFTILFSSYASKIQTLYFWDLSGAALGCVVMVPLLPPIGPGGMLFCASACALFASALLSVNRGWKLAAPVLGIALVAIPLSRSPDYIEFEGHLEKRGVKEASEKGEVELTRWDPVSKIDVFEQRGDDIRPGIARHTRRKHIAFDGGTQSSHIFAFDGDYARLRKGIDDHEERVWEHFWHRGVLASHYLERDSGAKVLVIGSAGGQETKAALMYGASSVDAVELVSAVVDIGKNRYREFNGGIFNDPRVHSYAAEGRSFLRGTSARYDIIQMHSNYTSSSIAAGTGAMSPDYLQTADAYREYFSHLTADGLLHINHQVFPRMIATAALAWKQQGRKDFQKHVLLFTMVGIRDPLPTLLIKMSPWTEREVSELETFFTDIGTEEVPFALMQNPLDPEGSFLPPGFFTGDLPMELIEKASFNVEPATDDHPFFNFLRKRIGEIAADKSTFTDESTALILNGQLRKGIVPMDLIHLIVTAVVSMLFGAVFILLPLYGSEVGRSPWSGKYAAMVYFSCLGAGFIVLELVFIQIFMKLVGYPVHTYALVIFTLLLGAGAGSLTSSKLGVSPEKRWAWPFLAILAYGSLFVLLYPPIFDHFLSSSDRARMIVSSLLILPLGFFLGMPLPLGILAVNDRPRGAIAWAWGMNGLFTIVGGLASVVLSIALGFRVTLLVALALYGLAFYSFTHLRRAPTGAL